MRGDIPPVGSLSERVQLLRKVETPGEAGGHQIAYVPVTTIWARVRARTARLGKEGDGRVALATHGVMLRFRKDLAPSDRILYRGRALEIVSLEDLNGRRAYLSCLCRESEVAA